MIKIEIEIKEENKYCTNSHIRTKIDEKCSENEVLVAYEYLRRLDELNEKEYENLEKILGI